MTPTPKTEGRDESELGIESFLAHNRWALGWMLGTLQPADPNPFPRFSLFRNRKAQR